MTEISNIDAIIELIMRDARARDRDNLFVSVFHVLEEVTDQIFPMIFKQRIEERRKKAADKQTEWNKGM